MPIAMSRAGPFSPLCNSCATIWCNGLPAPEEVARQVAITPRHFRLTWPWTRLDLVAGGKVMLAQLDLTSAHTGWEVLRGVQGCLLLQVHGPSGGHGLVENGGVRDDLD